MNSARLAFLLTLPLMKGMIRAALVVLLSAASVSVTAAQVAWSEDILRQAPEWYASVEARAVADNVIQYQSPQGGWPKNTDLAAWPPSAGAPGPATIDNDATTRPMRFLALMAQAVGEAGYREAFERGIDYLLAAQYPKESLNKVVLARWLVEVVRKERLQPGCRRILRLNPADFDFATPIFDPAATASTPLLRLGAGMDARLLYCGAQAVA